MKKYKFNPLDYGFRPASEFPELMAVGNTFIIVVVYPRYYCPSIIVSIWVCFFIPIDSAVKILIAKCFQEYGKDKNADAINLK